MISLFVTKGIISITQVQLILTNLHGMHLRTVRLILPRFEPPKKIYLNLHGDYSAYMAVPAGKVVFNFANPVGGGRNVNISL